MVTLFEFLGNEPIENVVTCMNFKVDKVIFFGYQNTINRLCKSHTRFLKSYCGVSEVIFSTLPGDDLQTILSVMRHDIDRELASGSKIYFDITGGEDLILVAFGMLSSQYNTPMHRHDIVNNIHIELDEGAKGCMSDDVPAQKVFFNIDRLIELRDGKINYGLQKSEKDTSNTELEEDVAKLWEFESSHASKWNIFSEYLRTLGTDSSGLGVSCRITSFRLRILKMKNDKLPLELDVFAHMLDELADIGILTHYSRSDSSFNFKYKNRDVKECIWMSGNPLEWHVYTSERDLRDDARLGIHFDWDGEIIPGTPDVDNEIDVVSLTGLIPTFISCKGGKMGKNEALNAFYELNTVADRFGGKYSKRILAVVNRPGEVQQKRADELGISIQVF